MNVEPRLSRRELMEEYIRNMKENEKKKFIEKETLRHEDESLMKNLKENVREGHPRLFWITI